VSSSNKRERELARAKRERQINRATSAKRKRGVFAPAALILVITLLVVWNKWNSDTTSANPSQSNTQSSSIYCGDAPIANVAAASFTKPDKMDLSKKSYQWVLNTNCGQIVIELDHKAAPTTVNSMLFLTENKFFDNTPCHRITTSGLFVLQCGDPTGVGSGGPGYKFKDENLPKQKENNYPAGTIAMANSGPGTNGSQFFIVYDDTTLGANYTIFGHVIKGLSIVQRVADMGAASGTDGPPNQPIGIKNARFTVEKDYSQTPKGSPSASPTSSKG
jgi:peptidyl-prolyl cis-trans isomerase B (cyclophilin B)